MDLRVGQLKDASLQRCHKSLHVQQGRVERDPSLVIRRCARRTFCLLLHLESCQIYDASNSVDHSLHDREWWHEAAGWG